MIWENNGVWISGGVWKGAFLANVCGGKLDVFPAAFFGAGGAATAVFGLLRWIYRVKPGEFDGVDGIDSGGGVIYIYNIRELCERETIWGLKGGLSVIGVNAGIAAGSAYVRGITVCVWE